MHFTPTSIQGAFVIHPEQVRDERGFFARIFCRDEFSQQGLNPDLAQASISFNPQRGTLRGMHYQAEPHQEAKLVRCTRGAVYDVTLDLRRGSRSFLKWHAVELSADNHLMAYVPEGCAHGLLTLQDNTEVHYQISQSYHPESARGVRWDDPAFAMTWPQAVVVVSDQDRSWKLFPPQR